MSVTPINFRQFAEDTAYTLIRQGLAVVVGVLTSAFLTRGLGVESRGVFTLVILMPTLVISITNLGVAPSTVYFVARNDFDLKTVIFGDLILTGFISLISILIGLLVFFLGRNFLFPNVPQQYLVASLMLIPVLLYNANLSAIIQGLKDFKAYNSISLFPQLVILLATLFLVWLLRAGILGAIIAYFFGNLFSLFIVYCYLVKKVGSMSSSNVCINYSFFRKIIRFGVKSYISNLITFLNYRFDKFLLNYFAGAVSLGLYDVSVGLSERIWMISQASSTVLFPQVASMVGGKGERDRITLLVARGVFLSSLLIAVPLFFFAKWLVIGLYGEEFSLSVYGFQFLLPGIISLSVLRVLSNDITGRGHPGLIALQSLISFGINVGCNLIFIPRYGFLGASISSSISYSASLVMGVITFCHLTGHSWTEIFIIRQEDLVLYKTLLNYALQKSGKILFSRS